MAIDPLKKEGVSEPSFHTHTILYFMQIIYHLHPQIAKARRGRRRGKVTATPLRHACVKNLTVFSYARY